IATSTPASRIARERLPRARTCQTKTARPSRLTRARAPAPIVGRRAGRPAYSARAGPNPKPSSPRPPTKIMALAHMWSGTFPRRAVWTRRSPAPQPVAANRAFEARSRTSGIAKRLSTRGRAGLRRPARRLQLADQGASRINDVQRECVIAAPWAGARDSQSLRRRGDVVLRRVREQPERIQEALHVGGLDLGRLDGGEHPGDTAPGHH